MAKATRMNLADFMAISTQKPGDFVLVSYFFLKDNLRYRLGCPSMAVSPCVTGWAFRWEIELWQNSDTRREMKSARGMRLAGQLAAERVILQRP
jgi:hypothetical protein